MLAFLADFLGGIVGFLVRFLPDSPLRAFGDVLEGASLGIGWLNWVIPIGPMLGVFTAWLVALLAWYGVRMVLTHGSKAIQAVAS